MRSAPLSSAEKMWSSVSTPLYIFMSRCLIEHRFNLLFSVLYQFIVVIFITREVCEMVSSILMNGPLNCWRVLLDREDMVM